MRVLLVLLSTCLVLHADDESLSFSDPDLRKFVNKLMRAALLEAEEVISRKCGGPYSSDPLCNSGGTTTAPPPWLPLPETEKPKWPKLPKLPKTYDVPVQPPSPQVPGYPPPLQQPDWRQPPVQPPSPPVPPHGQPGSGAMPLPPHLRGEPEVATFQPYPEVNIPRQPGPN